MCTHTWGSPAPLHRGRPTANGRRRARRRNWTPESWRSANPVDRTGPRQGSVPRSGCREPSPRADSWPRRVATSPGSPARCPRTTCRRQLRRSSDRAARGRRSSATRPSPARAGAEPTARTRSRRRRLGSMPLAAGSRSTAACPRSSRTRSRPASTRWNTGASSNPTRSQRPPSAGSRGCQRARSKRRSEA
jgi:hypothetical protein